MPNNNDSHTRLDGTQWPISEAEPTHNPREKIDLKNKLIIDGRLNTNSNEHLSTVFPIVNEDVFKQQDISECVANPRNTLMRLIAENENNRIVHEHALNPNKDLSNSAASNTEFFEECFSPTRVRRLSLDSSESEDLKQPPENIYAEDEDESKAIFRLNCLNASGRSHPDNQMSVEKSFFQEGGLDERLPVFDNAAQLPQFTQNLTTLFKSNLDRIVKKKPIFRKEPILKSRTNSQSQIKVDSPKSISQASSDSSVSMPSPENEKIVLETIPEEFGSHADNIPFSKDQKNLETEQIDAAEQKSRSKKEPGMRDTQSRQVLDSNIEEKPRCSCKRSKCLKLYCECFGNQRLCTESCNCSECYNKHEYADLRAYFLKDIIDKNPNAFKSKYKTIEGDKLTLHTRGCNCKKTGCQKRYCECFSANAKCTTICKCTDCLNFCQESEKIGVEKYHERAMRKRKRKTRSFVQNLVEKLKEIKPTEDETKQ